MGQYLVPQGPGIRNNFLPGHSQWRTSKKLYNKLLIQVLEDGGQNIVSNLRIPDPFRKNGCVFSDDKCIVRADQKCDPAGVVYRISCNNCSTNVGIEDTYNYVGCMRTTVHAGMVDHLKLQRQKNKSGALNRHDYEVHNREK